MIKVGVDNIIIKDGKILLIQRSRNSGNFPLCWGFVGGWMEGGELPEQSLTREALEEIGIETINHRFIGKVFSNLLPNGDTRIVLPYLTTLKEDKPIVIQKEEIEQAKWFTFKDALDLTWAYDHKEIFQYTLENLL